MPQDTNGTFLFIAISAESAEKLTFDPHRHNANISGGHHADGCSYCKRAIYKLYKCGQSLLLLRRDERSY